MGVRIDCAGLKRVLDETPADQNVMLTGGHGIGKSRILEDYFTQRGHLVVILFLGQMSDPGDLIGLPFKDDKTGKTDFMPPYWWPEDGKPIVLFLDELNRARPEVLQTVMDLTLNRTLAGKKLPEGSRIISAVNEGDEYQLTDLDPALVSRFNIYDFCPSVAEWLLWADAEKLDARVTSFISQNSDMLDGDKLRREDQGLEKTPDRRAWERVSRIITGKEKLDGFQKTILAGVVGMPAASRFIEFCSEKQLLSAKDLLLFDFEKNKAKLSGYSVPDLAAVNESVFRYLETAKIKDQDRKTAGKNLLAYFQFLKELKRREALAHFANLYSDGKYKKAIAFIIAESSPLIMEIAEFIESI